MADLSDERPLTGGFRRDGEALSLREYEALGGYQAIRKALQEMSPQDVADEVLRANLRGRGGAGFPAGTKWKFVPRGRDAPRPKYIIVNADEMEPGTFKDRYLLEGNPHQLIEGVLLCAYAIEAEVAYIFLRWEYRTAEERIAKALGEAREAGYIGRDLLGSEFSLHCELHSSAGRYMCGEETGLLNALEGKRAIPRAKPPYPQASGLWGRPTVVHNVETVASVPPIVSRGAEWFRGLSYTDEGGTKLYGVSGKVRRPGLWELPMGTTIREILEEHAGGMLPGHRFRGLLPGGASTDFLIEEHLDTRMDFASIQAAGSRMGTGTMVVLDDRTCPVGMVRSLETFFARESCGWCTPCREGLPWVDRTLRALEAGHGVPEDLEVLEMHTRLLGPGRTFCALAPGAVEPLQSALRFYRDDFTRHVEERRCPWR